MDENRKLELARCGANGTGAKPNERRFMDPWKGGSVLDIRGGGLPSHKSGVWRGLREELKEGD